MAYFAVDSDVQLVEAVNYAMANLGGSGLVANIETGVISAPGDPTPVGYLYQYINVRYANNSTGTSGFSSSPTNRLYYGLRNTTASAGSNNPADYIWQLVSGGGFGTTKFLFYSAIGGRQIVFTVATSSPGVNYQQVADGVAIDLDAITVVGATGPQGASGPSGPSGPTGPAGDRYATTSTTSLTIGTGSKTFTVETGLSYTPSQSVLIAHNASNEMTGTVTSYATGNGQMVANVVSTIGSGTYTSWDVNLTGAVGVPGATGPTGPGGATGPAGATGPSQRGPIALAFVISNATPIGANTATLNSWFSAPRTNVVAPIGTGETPINGDTAQFYYSPTNVGTVLNYNGSAWQNVTGNVIDGSLIVNGTIAANQIAANAVTAGKIQASAVTTDKLDANSVTTAKIAAGAVTADRIQANSITATQISTSYLYTGNIVSTGATLGNNSSPGYWLRYSDGAARFGGDVSIGSNLTVSGLITASGLNANTVATLTMQPNSVTNQARGTVGVVTLANPVVVNTLYSTPGATLTTTVANQVVLIYMTLGMEITWTAVGGSATRFGSVIGALRRYDASASPSTAVTLQSATKFYTLSMPTAGSTAVSRITAQEFPSYVDVVPSPGTYVYAFGGSVQLTTSLGNATGVLRTYQDAQDGTVFLNTITALGLAR